MNRWGQRQRILQPETTVFKHVLTPHSRYHPKSPVYSTFCKCSNIKTSGLLLLKMNFLLLKCVIEKETILIYEKHLNWVWQFSSVILELRRLQQKDCCELQASPRNRVEALSQTQNKLAMENLVILHQIQFRSQLFSVSQLILGKQLFF